eukprot:6609026-Karenia_brevis.AAC.1
MVPNNNAAGQPVQFVFPGGPQSGSSSSWQPASAGQPALTGPEPGHATSNAPAPVVTKALRNMVNAAKKACDGSAEDERVVNDESQQSADSMSIDGCNVDTGSPFSRPSTGRPLTPEEQIE